MSSTPAISLSGMRAAQTALDVSAHNIANLSTDGFRRQQVTQASSADQGVSTAVRQAPQAGHAIEADLVGQLQAKYAFLANLAVFRTHERMTGALLDAKA